MTYYDELGVSPLASADEIKEAYHRLARLLHPDNIRDQASRRVAECQMKRLNGVYKALITESSRRDYDQKLVTDLTVPEVVLHQVNRRRATLLGPLGVWFGAAILAAGLLVWAIASVGAGIEKRIVVPPPPGSPEPRPQRAYAGSQALDQLETRVTSLRQRYEDASTERDRMAAQNQALEKRIQDMSTLLEASPVEPAISPAAPALPPAPALEPPAVETSRQGLSGNWYYLPVARGSWRPAVYAPDYIEAIIVENQGTLRGRYHARYRVTDRAISPEVLFEFSGKAAPEAARLPWLGAAGARGEVRLRLVSDNRLEVAWVASDLGRLPGLASGTAVLVRKQEPVQP